ncbi:class 3 adenylate cyclase [Shimia isoporae]|uniref:Class 3 adenylate cyclase n=1 Tax=Shimia isoporae TaxID=647720 RepID=A0A4R1N6H8_9RHOB|nr:adenylate/guanylate cyclase domain-containing protein [Shimia isoporae]TCL00367.1 class 3 adenylate cyclase [Shimia isoporae]
MDHSDRTRRAGDPERRLRRLEKRLNKSEMRRAELEHLMDGGQAFQRRVIQEVEDAKAEIERLYESLSLEQARTNQLLRSIMPEAVAEELKERGRVRPRRTKSATVMFADFVNFTLHTENMDPVALVRTLDRYYSAFDAIAASHGVEKVKTIGDAYMCVAGNLADVQSSEHAAQMCRAAVDIMKAVADLRSEETNWSIRIGLHSGPISSGVVGSERLSYDIWGDTVNTAARVADATGINEIFLSESTHALLSDDQGTTYHGEVEAKGKGLVRLYQLIT